MRKKTLLIDDLSEYVTGVPVGFVGYWMGTVNNIPDGWFICNGSTFNSTLYPELYKALNNSSAIPDMTSSARFIRCSTTAGSKQGDAIRNIYGTFPGVGQHYSGGNDNEAALSGAFRRENSSNEPHNGVKVGNECGGKDDVFNFNASRVVPTANENRPINISAIPIIKHD
jgi:hypothetical protein